METFIISFAGEGIRDGYLEVTAYDENIARAWALREYGNNWSGIYTKADFMIDKEVVFPLGCFGSTTIAYERAEDIET